MKDFIQLKKKEGILKFVLKDEEGKTIKDEKEKEVYLEFDMGDIELPLKLNKCDAQHKKNSNYVKMQFQVIDKKQDKKGKFMLSYNEEEKCKVLKEFYKKEMEALDLFLGENGTLKLLNGRKPYWNMYDDINDMLEPILPVLKGSITNISDKIRNKYKEKEENVIE